MRERGLESKVGPLTLGSTGILLGFLFLLGNYSLHSGFTLDVDYNYVGSLQAGAPVKLSGIKVGKVKAVELYGGQPDPAGGGKRGHVRGARGGGRQVSEDGVGDGMTAPADQGRCDRAEGALRARSAAHGPGGGAAVR